MRKRLAFLFQLFLLACFQSSLFQFVVEETQVILVLSGFFYLAFHFPNGFLQFHILAVSLLVVRAQGIILSDDIDHAELEVFFLQQQVLVL